MKKPGGSKIKKSSKRQSFILIVGDEGGILIHLQGRQVIKRIFCATPEPEQLKAINEQLQSAPKAPILVLVDMMDQSYVRQTLPPVSSFNVGKIIRRRLSKDFSSDDIKGYIVFGREKKGRKDWNYLMASLANSQTLQKWIDFVIDRTNPFKGIGLLPLEIQPLLQVIENHLTNAGKDFKATEWHILISHHKVGGFRQVVLRQRQLVFTRLAQLVGEPTPDVITGNIEQELMNTLEYLKRLGLQDTSALTVTIVASGEIKAVFEPKILKPHQYHFYTPYEMAEICSVKEFAKPEDHYGDVVMAGWIGTRRKMLLTLFTAYTRKLAKLARFIMLTRSVAALLILGIVGWVGMVGYDWYTTQGVIEDAHISRASLQAQFSAEEGKKKALPEKIAFYSDVATAYRMLYKPTYDPLYFVLALPQAVGNQGFLKNIHWTLTPAIPLKEKEDKRIITADFEVQLTWPQEPREKYVENAQKLAERVKKALPDFDVSNTDLPGMISDSKELKTTISETGETVTSQKESLISTIKFNIKGPVTRSAQAIPLSALINAGTGTSANPAVQGATVSERPVPLAGQILRNPPEDQRERLLKMRGSTNWPQTAPQPIVPSTPASTGKP